MLRFNFSIYYIGYDLIKKYQYLIKGVKWYSA